MLTTNIMRLNIKTIYNQSIRKYKVQKSDMFRHKMTSAAMLI